MPNIFLFGSAATLSELTGYQDELGALLRKATAEVLPGVDDPGDVAVMALPWIFADNASSVQIFAVANWSQSRELSMAVWVKALKEAFAHFRGTHPELTINFDDADVWTIMPHGLWSRIFR